MTGTLIKNNLKLMLRSKWILVLMIVLPLITIGVLATVFQSMLKNGSEMKPFTAGYKVSDSSISEEMIAAVKTIAKENDITFVAYPDADIESLIKGGNVTVFVEMNMDTVTLYQLKKNALEGTIIETMISSVLTAYTDGAILGKNIVSTDVPSSLAVNTTMLNTDPLPTSMDYYGIIEIVYFLWCGMVSLAAVMTSERKNHIERRLKATPISGLGLFLGKLTPCFLANIIEIGIAMVLSILLFDVHWGNPIMSAVILLMLTLTISAFAIVLFYLFKNMAISIVVGWILIFGMGFLGGSFNTYMYSLFPHKLEVLSPIYHINRTLVEYSTMGKSSYTGSSIAFLLAIFSVCMVAGIVLINRKMEVEHQ